MKVIGIDPGTASCGYGIVHESDGRLRAIDHGWWKTSAVERPELRLKTIFAAVVDLIEVHRPDAVALEESFVGADARTALSVGQAHKQQVQKMVKAILSLQAAPTPSHASDALAVAICHALAPPLLRIAG